MDENNTISIAGQWFGYFIFGPQYGRKLRAQRVTFSLLIEDVFNNKFSGKCIEIEGLGASSQIATITGFVENNFISFRKEYPVDYTIDKDGNRSKYPDMLKPRLSYEGLFNKETQTYSGSWEIWGRERPAGENTIVHISRGTWEISRDSSTYGI